MLTCKPFFEGKLFRHFQKISELSFGRHFTAGLAIALLLFVTQRAANADETFSGISVPGNVVYDWTSGNRLGGTGNSITLTKDYGVNDFIDIESFGSVDYFAGGGARINGAGVGLSSSNLGQASTRVDPNGSVLNNGGLTFWSSNFGATRLFIPSSEHGLGSATPPEAVSTRRSVGDIFGQVNGFNGLTAGQTLHILPVDSNTGNIGSYQVDLTFSSVPEPSSLALAGLLASLIACLRNRR